MLVLLYKRCFSFSLHLNNPSSFMPSPLYETKTFYYSLPFSPLICFSLIKRVYSWVILKYARVRATKQITIYQVFKALPSLRISSFWLFKCSHFPSVFLTQCPLHLYPSVRLWQQHCFRWRWSTHGGTCQQSSGEAPSSSACSVLQLPCWTQPVVTLWVSFPLIPSTPVLK